MLITIAIPTYNGEKTIAMAIKSALNQDYDEKYEILIVNNASKDKTQEVIESFTDEKIRVVVNKQTYDMYTNHNICLDEAKGDYVVFCHSDDELLPSAVSILSKRIRDRNFPKNYILWGHSMLYDFQKKIENGGQKINQMFSGENASACFLNGGLTPSGTCYSRKSLLELGAFPSNTNPIMPSDWFILIWAAFNFFEFEMIDRIILKRTFYTTSASVENKKQITRANIEMFNILFGKLNDSQKTKFLGIASNYGSFYLLKLIKNKYSWPSIFCAGINIFLRLIRFKRSVR